MDDAPRFVTVDDYEPVARERLPSDVYDFYAGGAGDEWTLAENRRAFDRWRFRPRCPACVGPTRPVDLDPRDARVLPGPGGAVGVPIDGASRRRASDARAPRPGRDDHGRLVDARPISWRTSPDASDAPKWWQLYVFEDRAATTDMLARVVDAGYGAICLTVDLQVFGSATP